MRKGRGGERIVTFPRRVGGSSCDIPETVNYACIESMQNHDRNRYPAKAAGHVSATQVGFQFPPICLQQTPTDALKCQRAESANALSNSNPRFLSSRSHGSSFCIFVRHPSHFRSSGTTEAKMVSIERRAPSREIWLCRLLFCALLVLATLQKPALDAFVERVWASLRTSWCVACIRRLLIHVQNCLYFERFDSHRCPICRWFQLDSFEPLLAPSSFAASVLLFRFVDQRCTALHRYRIGGAAAAQRAAAYSNFKCGRASPHRDSCLFTASHTHTHTP